MHYLSQTSEQRPLLMQHSWISSCCQYLSTFM